MLQEFLADHLSNCGILGSWQSRDELVENGDEQYFPALQIGPTASSFSVVSVYSCEIICKLLLSTPLVTDPNCCLVIIFCWGGGGC